MGGSSSVATNGSPCVANAPAKEPKSFEEVMTQAQDVLQKLGVEVEELIRDHVNAEAMAKEYPLELQETSEEAESRYTTLKQECIRLEELLVRVQLKLDEVKLPRTVLDGEEVPDPVARASRKSIVQQAESLIQRLHQLRKGNAKL
mmetsp:Transcript_13253/g.16654  ORF Transcript_13253/g.16654 Transcript_13253/m.16654 type:complete len:146 (-) Transcript_13253:137-574(-)|eukprot:CAMPEP_0206202834 /NCGR_PEP_ID=MMETSP0166-20121206/12429_1 /ASSEMBLY_ACC=CAM_ASM_000260 /TAXON_ID=95228 /ORGANISM="Vannella robusta, Strain DIVA3 518/3/11/1/6" /LENGTH=145 /DNA_ID=CAMNT_0053621875 /DNA_START=193 /DNA_END=630 /DNA_ORIENTATION=-